MWILKYCCLLVGEDADKARRYHESSLRRLKAFAIAIHLPVLLWLVSAFAIATQVFGLPWHWASAVAALCAAFIFLVERLVLATPASWLMNVARMVLGLVIAVIGASLFDLVLFEREISQQLSERGEQRMRERHDAAVKTLEQQVEQKRNDWLEARQQAQCEANGRCGGGKRGTGPIFEAANRHAQRLQQDYESAQAQLQALQGSQAQELAERTPATLLQEAGVLARIKALHEFVTSDRLTLATYIVLFLLVACVEFMVVIVKYAFKAETVDDRLQSMRERLSESRASAYMEAVSSPAAGAKRLLHQMQ
jgi:hypothetical protein